MEQLKPTPKTLALFTTDSKGDPIFEDSYLRARRWHPPTYTSATCYLWRVERGKTGQLMLVAEGAKKRVPLTEGRARELSVYPASKRIKLADYPEEWAWWRASGWGLSVSDYDYPADHRRDWVASTGIQIEADRRNSRRGFGLRDGNPEEEAISKDPAQVQRLLRLLLYLCVHPRKAEALEAQAYLPDEVEAAFVQEQRRKVAKLGVS